MELLVELWNSPKYNWLAFKTWVTGYRKMQELPKVMRIDGLDNVANFINSNEEVSVEVPQKHVEEYNALFEPLKKALRDYPAASWLAEPYRTYPIGLVRIALCVATMMGMLSWWENLGTHVLLQAILCPMSFVCVLGFCASSGPDILSTHIVNFVLGSLYLAVTPQWIQEWTVFPVTWWLPLVYLAYDIVMSLYLWLFVSDKKAKRGASTIYLLWWGFLTSMTNIAHAQVLAIGNPIILPVHVLDLVFNISLKLSIVLYDMMGLDFDAAQYLEHRLGHLPHLYEQAHKNHHVGPTNPFNYLMGLQEFTGMVMIEGIASNLLGTCPHYCTVRYALNLRLYKRDHTHYGNPHDAADDHSYHHTNPNRNFCLCWNGIDVLYGTHRDEDRTDVPAGGEVVRRRKGDKIVISWRRRAGEKPRHFGGYF